MNIGLLFPVLQVGDRNGACHGHGGDGEEGEAERVVFAAVADEEGDVRRDNTAASGVITSTKTKLQILQ